MSTDLWLAAIAAALATGYTLGRLRPLDRLDTWVWRQMAFVGPWMTGTKARQLVLFTAHGIVRPAATWHAWRHRNDPPPPRSPAVTFRTPGDPDA